MKHLQRHTQFLLAMEASYNTCTSGVKHTPWLHGESFKPAFMSFIPFVDYKHDLNDIKSLQDLKKDINLQYIEVQTTVYITDNPCDDKLLNSPLISMN